jgi:septal ring factor EnvC (AmiA/AmiB activator)
VVRKRFRGSKIPCLIAGLFLVAAAADAVHAGKPSRTHPVEEKQLETSIDRLTLIKKEIETRRKKIRDLEKVEGNYLARLEYLETNVDASRKYLTLLSIRIDTAESTIIRLTDSVKASQGELFDRQSIMKQRLRKAYMTGASSPFIALVMTKNPLDIVHRIRYLEAVHRYDRDLAMKIDSTRKNIDRKKSDFELVRSRLARLLADKKAEQSMLVKEEASRRALLEDVRSKKKSNQMLIADLEAVQRELNEVVRILQDKRKKNGLKPLPSGKSVFGRQKATLPWPLEGEIVAQFGRIVHPLYQTVTMNNGIDIRSHRGGQVRCVADGTVMYIGSMRGLGRIVIVDHGDGYLTIYARLETIECTAGSRVSAGSAIGSVESEGNVHFEIRQSTESLDPAAWLVKR